MILIRCPHCRELRAEDELVYGGEAGLIRPAESVDDVQWTDYLFMRANPKGMHCEQWCCSAGCGQWFEVMRDTVTHRITAVAKFQQLVAPSGEMT
ncbi:sarcosine oxidase subunit delta [Steroidobacter sp.]|uniref:sarcosine oxidase subunit delta n=1 Tax=Steroidobacter sp. TaxID=1978227 RepID=UPI001A3E35D7|nr:sarcosine oxidase subunit delta [Steroidobacter sp.]MBL8265366.1 sarcosine oxidase subunit delta [Steroidobacter sp.]